MTRHKSEAVITMIKHSETIAKLTYYVGLGCLALAVCLYPVIR
jgi:hypothetical protein